MTTQIDRLYMTSQDISSSLDEHEVDEICEIIINLVKKVSKSQGILKQRLIQTHIDYLNKGMC